MLMIRINKKVQIDWF